MNEGFDLDRLGDEFKKFGIDFEYADRTRVRVIREVKGGKEYETYVMTIPEYIAKKIGLREGIRLFYTDVVYEGGGLKVAITALTRDKDIPSDVLRRLGARPYGGRKVRRRNSTLEIGIPKEYIEAKGLKEGDIILLLVEKGTTNILMLPVKEK